MSVAYALAFLIGIGVLMLASIGGRAGMSARDRWAMLRKSSIRYGRKN